LIIKFNSIRAFKALFEINPPIKIEENMEVSQRIKKFQALG